jgi:hypothetical protein
MATKKKKEEEMPTADAVRLMVGTGELFSQDIILREAGPCVRLTYDYPLKDALQDKYSELLTKFNVNKTSGSIVAVPAPMHLNGTYMILGTYAKSGKSQKFWTMVRAYDRLRFNSEFVDDGKTFVPRCMGGSSAGAPVVVPDAQLQAPAGYRYVIVLRASGAMYLFGARDKDHAIFNVPVPNISWPNGHLCEGHQLNSKIHKAVKANTTDASVFTQLMTAWEEAQWNSDLVSGLPQNDARAFLKWDIKGKHLAEAKVWDALAKSYPISASHDDTNIVRASIDTYLKETDRAICARD